MATLLRMPEISANTVEAVLSEWPLPENTEFAAGDAIATVETDKAVVDVPAADAGVLLRTLVEPGKSVSVGSPLAVLGAPGEIVDDLDALVEQLTGQPVAEAVPAAEAPTPAGTREVTQGAEPATPSSAAAAAPSDSSAVISATNVDSAASGALSATSPASAAASLSSATAAALSATALRSADTPGVSPAAAEAAAPPASAGVYMDERRPQLAGAQAVAAPAREERPGGDGDQAARIFASPLARRIAKENGIAVGDIDGTGPGGRIIRDDVKRIVAARSAASGNDATAPEPAQPNSLATSASSPLGPEADSAASVGEPGLARAQEAGLAGSAASPAGTGSGFGQGIDSAGSALGQQISPAVSTASAQGHEAGPASSVGGSAPYLDIPHTRMRRAIADRLTRSNQEAPVFSIRGSARVDALLALRKELNEGSGVKISITDLIVAAAARAHVAVPEMNAIWMADAVRRFADVDIAVAVATDSGLVTPVVRAVQRQTVSALATTTADLVARARGGKLRQNELEGGTLTVTNLGVFGTEDFTAVINPPQAAILAVGAARPEAVVTDGEIGVANILRVTLSVDHRPVDGATAARWMAAFLGLVQAPLRILV